MQEGLRKSDTKERQKSESQREGRSKRGGRRIGQLICWIGMSGEKGLIRELFLPFVISAHKSAEPDDANGHIVGLGKARKGKSGAFREGWMGGRGD